LAALRDINDIRVLHKPMGLGEIARTLMEMIPTTATGFGVATNARFHRKCTRRRPHLAEAPRR